MSTIVVPKYHERLCSSITLAGLYFTETQHDLLRCAPPRPAVPKAFLQRAPSLTFLADAPRQGEGQTSSCGSGSSTYALSSNDNAGTKAVKWKAEELLLKIQAEVNTRNPDLEARICDQCAADLLWQQQYSLQSITAACRELQLALRDTNLSGRKLIHSLSATHFFRFPCTLATAQRLFKAADKSNRGAISEARFFSLLDQVCPLSI